MSAGLNSVTVTADPNPPPQDSAEMPLFQSKYILAFYNSQHTPPASIPSRLLTSLRGYANVASSNLTTWASNLLEHFPASIRELVTPQEAKTSGTFDRFSSLNSTATVSTLTALLLALFYFAAKFLMSTYYRSSLDGYGGGRRSPYASGIPRDMLDHVEYLTSDSIDDRHTNHHRASSARPQVPAADPEGAPDVVLLKSKGQEYKLHFVPFAISDGLLLVGDLRKYAAEKLNADPKRVRLLYKRVTLEDDRRPATDYGVKQNSTVSCVLAEGGNSAIDSSSDDNIPSSRAGTQPRRQQRPRGQSNVRHRSEEQIPVQSSFLHPANAGIPRQTERPVERPTRHDSLRTPTNGDYRRQRSHSRAPSPDPSVATSSSAASIPVFDFKPPKFPSRYDEAGPFGKLKALSDTLYNTWLPLCDRYIRHPPSEPKEREKECKRLTESILAKVTLELDNVDLMGINEARTIRKELVECANKVMGRCDERNWEVNPRKEG